MKPNTKTNVLLSVAREALLAAVPLNKQPFMDPTRILYSVGFCYWQMLRCPGFSGKAVTDWHAGAWVLGEHEPIPDYWLPEEKSIHQSIQPGLKSSYTTAVVDQVNRFKVALIAACNYEHKTIGFVLGVWELSTLSIPCDQPLCFSHPVPLVPTSRGSCAPCRTGRWIMLLCS